MSNRDIIEHYYRLHHDELLAFAGSRLCNQDEAEDIVQDVFLRLLDGKNPIIETTLPALAYTLARHKITDYYRRRRYCQDSCEPLQKLVNHHAADNAESVALVHEATALLERGLLRVAEPCREPYRMHIFGGMQVSDIVRETGQSYKSVEYRIGLARKEVRKQLIHVI